MVCELLDGTDKYINIKIIMSEKIKLNKIKYIYDSRIL